MEPDTAQVKMIFDDEIVRKIMEYLIKTLAASKLKISYDLKLPPEAVDDAMRKMEEAKLIRTQSGRSRDVYSPTEAGLEMKPFLFSKFK
jgi:predicted transcriptional regulator